MYKGNNRKNIKINRNSLIANKSIELSNNKDRKIEKDILLVLIIFWYFER